jgi:pimeloyl-ACP methyl ester carboxylesterase
MEPQPGVVCRWDFPSSVDGTGIPCSVYLPRGYNPALAYPVWVELHALYALPIIDNDSNNPFSNELKRLADERGWIILAPWGRNLHSFFADGIDRGDGPYREPDIYDDFAQGAAQWLPVGGDWRAQGGRYSQYDRMPQWKESLRVGSTGENYAVRVRIRDLTPPGTTSAVGVNLRRGDNGDCYHVDLYRGLDDKRYVRLYKLEGGVWQGIATVPYDWRPLNPLDGWVDLKVSCYEEYLEVYVNEQIVNLQPGYDATPYGYGWDVPGDPLPPGGVSLCSFGGVHEFDDVRIQNEYPYGERDVLDCILGAMEKYRIDPSRIYVAGHSQGGLGAYILGLHHPDLFAALRPADGMSDLYYDYKWWKTWYPPDPGEPYAAVNDGRLTEYTRQLAGGEPDPGNPEMMSVLHANSARYILENGVNNYWRIVHGTPDANVPNSYQAVQICWWAPFFFFWAQTPAPEPYTWAVSTYANGLEMAQALQSWSRQGPYYAEYITDPNIGHGLLDPYADTADFFQGKVLERNPEEVAYKTYDETNDGAWWLRLEIPRPGMDEPGMARVKVDRSANAAAVHARNVSVLTLDLGWMGLDYGEGETLRFHLDDDTSPVLMPVHDTLGKVTLRLAANWRSESGYRVRLDGTELVNGTDYRFQGPFLEIIDLPTTGGHLLEITAPSFLPPNLLPDPGAEQGNVGGYPVGWTGMSPGGGGYFLWEDLESHEGSRSLRVKDAVIGGEGVAWWKSDPLQVQEGRGYRLSAFSKVRMFRGGAVRVGIAWYDGGGGLLSIDWSDPLNDASETCNREWTPLEVSAEAPSNASYARVVAGVTGEAGTVTTGSAWFDEFLFTAM